MNDNFVNWRRLSFRRRPRANQNEASVSIDRRNRSEIRRIHNLDEVRICRALEEFEFVSAKGQNLETGGMRNHLVLTV